MADIGLLLLGALFGAVLSFSGGLYAKRLEQRREARVEMLRRLPQTIEACERASPMGEDDVGDLRHELEQLDRLGVISGFRDHARTSELMDRLVEVDFIHSQAPGVEDPAIHSTVEAMNGELSTLQTDLELFGR